MLVGADVFIGVSAPSAVTTEMVKVWLMILLFCLCKIRFRKFIRMMLKQQEQELFLQVEAIFQIKLIMFWRSRNFSWSFDVRAKDINNEMKIAAAEALANLISEDELSPEYFIPKAFDKRVGSAVAKAVADAARDRCKGEFKMQN